MTVRLDGVTVHAPGRERAVIDRMTMQLSAGERVALTGVSGSGKTTLLDALARLRPCQGEILLDGMALSAWDELDLRREVAYVGQRPYLFEGPLAENIRLACPHADDAEVRAAARRAGVLDFASRLAGGLDTPLGPRGFGLSGGEAHRVALARLYLRTPRLILLDEPTAHLDAATEAAVWEACLAFSGNATVLVATHAQAVAARCDRSIVLEVAEGRAS